MLSSFFSGVTGLLLLLLGMDDDGDDMMKCEKLDTITVPCTLSLGKNYEQKRLERLFHKSGRGLKLAM